MATKDSRLPTGQCPTCGKRVFAVRKGRGYVATGHRPLRGLGEPPSRKQCAGGRLTAIVTASRS